MDSETFSFTLLTDDGFILYEGNLKAIRELHNTLEGMLQEFNDNKGLPIPVLRYGNRNKHCGPFLKRVI